MADSMLLLELGLCTIGSRSSSVKEGLELRRAREGVLLTGDGGASALRFRDWVFLFMSS